MKRNKSFYYGIKAVFSMLIVTATPVALLLAIYYICNMYHNLMSITHNMFVLLIIAVVIVTIIIEILFCCIIIPRGLENNTI